MRVANARYQQDPSKTADLELGSLRVGQKLTVITIMSQAISKHITTLFVSPKPSDVHLRYSPVCAEGGYRWHLTHVC